MASKLGEAFVAITSKDMGLSAGFKKARRDTERETTAMQKSGERAASAIGAAFKRVGIMAGVAIAAGAGFWSKSIIQLAMDAGETQNKFDVAFKGMAASAEAWSEKFSKSVGGLNTYTLKDMAGQFQLLFNAMNIDPKEATALSTSLTQLSYDLASLYNTSIDEAFTRLQSGLVGETEAVRRFGVDVSEAALKNYALANGMKKNVENMSQSEKVLLRYQMIMAQTTDAQGDLQRTQDSTANRVRLLKERFQMLSIHLGTQLLPHFNKILGHLSNLVSWVDKNSSKFSGFINVAKRMGGALRDTGKWFGGLWDKLNAKSPKMWGAVWQDVKNLAESFVELAEALKPFYKLYFGAAFLALAQGIKMLAEAFGMFAKIAAPVMDFFTKMFDTVAKLLGMQDKQVKKQKEINKEKKEEAKIPPVKPPAPVAKDYTEEAKSLWELIKQKREDAKATLDQMRAQIGFVSSSELYEKAATMGAQMQFKEHPAHYFSAHLIEPGIRRETMDVILDERARVARDNGMIDYLARILSELQGQNKAVQY